MTARTSAAPTTSARASTGHASAARGSTAHASTARDSTVQIDAAPDSTARGNTARDSTVQIDAALDREATAPVLDRSAAPLRPVLRLLPTPSCAPPYDDEVASPAALRLVPAAGTRAPVAPPHTPAASHVSPGRPRLHRHHAQPPVALPPVALPPVALPPVDQRLARRQADDHAPPPRTATTELPPPRPVAHALVQRLLEVSAGVRPVTQLRPDTTPQLFEQLERALLARPRATGLRPSRRDVRSVHVQDRPDGVAEVCATVVRGRRIAAIALRLEGVRGRWVCTQVVGV